MNQAGIVKLLKRDMSGEVVDEQETYNKEFVDAAVQNILTTVDAKIAAAIAGQSEG